MKMHLVWQAFCLKIPLFTQNKKNSGGESKLLNSMRSSTDKSTGVSKNSIQKFQAKRITIMSKISKMNTKTKDRSW